MNWGLGPQHVSLGGGECNSAHKSRGSISKGEGTKTSKTRVWQRLRDWIQQSLSNSRV